jgi:hypothetical protein
MAKKLPVQTLEGQLEIVEHGLQSPNFTDDDKAALARYRVNLLATIEKKAKTGKEPAGWN